MQQYNQDRETDVNQRLFPSKSHPRYYVLTQITKNLQSLAEKHLKQQVDNIYDFGCGIMPYRQVFQPYARDYIGIDLPGNSLAQVYIDKDGKAALKDATADVVLSNQVMEHVASPQTYLDECYRMLKPEGLLICSTHGYWKYHPDPNDYWRWTGEGLRKIIEETGFQVKEFAGVCNLASSSIVLLQDAVYHKIKNKFYRKAALRFFQTTIAFLDKHVKGNKEQEASVFIVIAKKV